MQQVCRDVGVDRFEDIMAVIALFRPGPMDQIPEYCARKRGEKEITYFHQSLEKFLKPILASTYGVLVYQESVMRICEALSGMSKIEALTVIKGIGKKKEEIILKGKKAFIDGAIKNGIERGVIENYWEHVIMPFASYGFNLSHSAGYGYFSYITAYLKANFPEEYLCSFMNVEIKRKKYEKVQLLEKECEFMGIKVLPKDINKCELECKIAKHKDEINGIPYSEIRPSLHCKGISASAPEEIIKKRPFYSPKDLAEKTDSSVSVRDVDALCEAKFFKTNKEKVLSDFEIFREDAKRRKLKGDDDSNAIL
jgi:DNA polymerase-3 subunit alpha